MLLNNNVNTGQHYAQCSFKTMMKRTLSILLASLAIGCSSNQTNDERNHFKTMTAGKSAAHITNLYWYTERLGSPYSAADFVISDNHGWYETDYRWRDGMIREVIRKGEQQKTPRVMRPYRIHLRFNNQGQAVYQQYRFDGKVLPLAPEQINFIQSEAESARQIAKKQHNEHFELIQGHWDGKVFSACSGNKYEQIKLNQALPSSVLNRVARLDSYVAFVGLAHLSRLTVEELLILEDKNYACIKRPVFIKDE